MNIIGERVRIIDSSDPKHIGIEGTVLLETANTFIIEKSNKKIRVQKRGSVFEIIKTGLRVSGVELRGRLEDRIGRIKA